MGHSLFVLPILFTAIVSFGLEVNIVHKWKHCQYESEQQKEDAISAYSSYMSIFIDAKRVNSKLVTNYLKKLKKFC